MNQFSIPSKEALDVEFETDSPECEDDVIFKTVVALANTNGGTLYLGVEDDGTVTGVRPDDGWPYSLAAYIANNTIPPQSVRIERLGDKEDEQVLAISVPRSRDELVSTADGEHMRRQLGSDGSPETVPMHSYEMANRLTHIRVMDPSARAVLEAELSDFDPQEIERLRRQLQSDGADAGLLELSDDNLFKSLGLIAWEEGRYYPTVAGLLLLGRPESLKKHVPTHTTAFQELSGSETLESDDFRLPILASIERLDDHIQKLNSAQEAEAAKEGATVPLLDPSAVREAIANAYSHRDYAKLGPVRVTMSDDGLTVANPGAFVEGVTLHALMHVESRGRNQLLASILKRIGVAEKAGRGLDKIFSGSLVYGGDMPDYSASTPAETVVTLPRIEPRTKIMELVSSLGNALGVRRPDTHQLLVLNAIARGGPLTARSLETLTGLEEFDLGRILRTLQRQHLVMRDETGDAGALPTYRLRTEKDIRFVKKPGRFPVPDLPEGVEADPLTPRERQLLVWMQEHEATTVADIAMALGLSQGRVRTLLGSLRNKGLVEKAGGKRFASYRSVPQDT